jgi:hypothetical protein
MKEKKHRGRPKGSKGKQKAHQTLNNMQAVIRSIESEYEKITHIGQKTICKKCGIEMTFFMQPKVKEDKLKDARCSVCQN